jgi:hypothetical protein
MSEAFEMRSEAHRSASLGYLIRIRKYPRSNAAITRIIHPLRTVNLRSALVHRNTIFQIRGMPERGSLRVRKRAEQPQHFLLKLGFTIVCRTMSHAASA